ncbi:hypothetical protein N7510_001426 [Penicillium lagena]|uniref:uncharacterized protein n=1 Tax=Penicillium lagena TaxID=94218 RepID=UPI002540FC22|nr:uncharacterized protein N7510_001426 [Penicillium lagena]KAJ5625117.1 hypothetical protein N7510_001426 [Penicillium lagena]
MFLCSWSSLCLNVPAQTDSQGKIFRRKIYLTALALLGPEFIFQIALSQWESAHQSVKDFNTLGIKGWTMTHAFYADMGGFHLKTDDFVAFPINAKQLHYLITNGYVDAPVLDKKRIADKNKVDSMLRLLTLFQTLWFIINVCGRASQNLEICTGELTTAAFIVCSVSTTVCWYQKPADVQTPEILVSSVTLDEILRDAGDQAKRPYRYTPLDFVSRNEWSWSLYWSNWVNILRKLRIMVILPKRPVDRFQNTIVSKPSTFGSALFYLLTVIYASIFVAGWNYSFPTTAEKILWRVSSTGVLLCAFLFWAIGHFSFSFYPKHVRPYSDARTLPKTISQALEPATGHPLWDRFKHWVEMIGQSIRNNSWDRDPELAVPLKAILPIYVLGVIYCHARAFIFLEDVIQLRSLPTSAYLTMNWSGILPHF